MSNAIKQVRGQIRQIVKELLPDLLSNEFMQAIERRLVERLDAGLTRINDRQKDLQAYMVRNSVAPAEAPKAKEEDVK